MGCRAWRAQGPKANCVPTRPPWVCSEGCAGWKMTPADRARGEDDRGHCQRGQSQPGAPGAGLIMCLTVRSPVLVPVRGVLARCPGDRLGLGCLSVLVRFFLCSG